MKLVFLISLIFFLSNCSKPKTVLICGDHVCVNKAEAKQYFEENLTIEVKIIDQKVESEIDLVELNLTDSKNGKRKIIHFGDSRYQQYRDKLKHYSHLDHNDLKKRKSYFARHGPSNDKNTAKYWSHKILWHG